MNYLWVYSVHIAVGRRLTKEMDGGQCLWWVVSIYTGRFIMFSVITNIYNKKTKGHTLMNCSQPQKNWKSFFLTTRDVRCVHHRWHGTHRHDIQVLATHVSTYFSLLQWSVPLGMILSVGQSFAYFSRNARCTVTTDLLVWYSNTQNDFSPGAAIFSLHTLASPSGRDVNYDEKQLNGKKKFEFFLLSVQVL